MPGPHVRQVLGKQVRDRLVARARRSRPACNFMNCSMTEAVGADANPPPHRRIVSDPDRRLHRGKDPELELPVAQQGQDVDRDLDSVCRRDARLAAGNYREQQTQAAGSVLRGFFYSCWLPNGGCHGAPAQDPRLARVSASRCSVVVRESRASLHFIDRFRPSLCCHMPPILPSTEPERYLICPGLCRASPDASQHPAIANIAFSAYDSFRASTERLSATKDAP